MNDKKDSNNAGAKWVVIIFVLVLVCSIFITEIMASKGEKMANILGGEDEKLVLLTDNECTTCGAMEKALKEVKTKTSIINYTVNIDKLSDSDLSTLLASSDLIDEKDLPAVLHVSAGAVIGNYKGAAKAEDIIAFTNVFKQITVDQYIELVKEDVEHFVYIGRPTCGYCVQSIPWTKRISSALKKDIYYINIDAETASDLQLLAENTKNVYKGSTPLFLITKSNEILRYKEGASSYIALTSFFEGTDGE